MAKLRKIGENWVTKGNEPIMTKLKDTWRVYTGQITQEEIDSQYKEPGNPNKPEDFDRMTEVGPVMYTWRKSS